MAGASKELSLLSGIGLSKDTTLALVLGTGGLALLLAAVAYQRRSDGLYLQADEVHDIADAEPVQVQGLRNIGNTCFINSMIQALGSLPAFVEHVQQLERVVGSCRFLGDLRGLLEGRVSDPRLFHNSLTKEARMFRGFDQHDAHELFAYLLDILETKLKKVRPALHMAGQTRGLAACLVRPLDDRGPKLPNATSEYTHLTTSTTVPRPSELPQAARQDLANEKVLASGSTHVDEVAASGAMKIDGADDAHPAESDAAESGHSTAISSTFAEDLGSDPMDVKDPFTGLRASFLQCHTCGYQSSVLHSVFNSLSLHLGQAAVTSVDECLRRATAKEVVDGVRCDMCTVLDHIARLDRRLALLTVKKQNALRCKKLTGMLQQRREVVAVLCKLDPGRRAPPLPPLSPWTPSPDSSYKIKLEPVRRSFVKQLLPVRLPTLLCLHVARLLGGTKLTTHIRFPLELDLAPYTVTVSDYALRDRGRASGAALHPEGTDTRAVSDIDLEDLLSLNNVIVPGPVQDYIAEDADESIAKRGSIDPTPTESRTLLYRLSAVVVHHGSADFGHFTTYRLPLVTQDMPTRSKANLYGEWLHISDDSVYKVPVREVMACQAYMLFYHRMPQA